MKYRFENTVKVAGRLYRAGDEVAAGEIPAGYFESCVRVGHLKPVPGAPDPAEVFARAMEAAAPAPAADPAPAVPPPAAPPAPAPKSPTKAEPKAGRKK